MATEVSFVPHCDEPGCSLGSCKYACPKCGKAGTDYDDAWWRHDEVYEGKAVGFECEHCRAKLELFLHDHCVYVRQQEAPVTDKKCETCPQSEGIFTGKNAEVFLMAVVNVPGRVPVIVTTPRFCKELPENATPCDVCTVVGDLIDNTVIKGAVDIAAEIRNKFKPKEAPCQADPSPQTPADSPSSEPSTSSDCPKPNGCGNCGN